MTITVGSNNYEFSMSSDEQSWTSEVLVRDRKVEIEIDKRTYKQENVDWGRVKDFIGFINKSEIVSDLVNESILPLRKFADAFWRKNKNEVKDYEMKFTGIYFHGVLDSESTNLYSYSLIFNFLTIRDNRIFGDEYGLYLAEIEHLNIVSVRRIQL
ncbi:MAG: hypothetical protein MUE81_17010 [Thermoflexibacter sp.]|jgi:hypothetical protein|nr:hypothetical protein [Thermoflexibacter sp.]